MSSFICSSKHFNSIEKALQNYFSGSRASEYSYKFYNYLDCYNSTLSQIEYKIKQFVNTLRELNVLCVTLQYKHHYDGRLDTEIKEQRESVFNGSEYKEINLYGLVKALGSLNYQIEPEHLTELRNLTPEEKTALKLLNDLKYDICYHIVCNDQKYEKSDWEIN
jgi:hypothetical protein